MDTYLYLIYSGLFLGALIVALRLRWDLWNDAWPFIILGAIANPINELLYFRDYWRPHDLLGTGRVSIEDVIFGASVYGLTAISYPFFLQKHISTETTCRRPLYRAGLSLSVVTVLILILNLGLGINSVVAFVLAILPCWGYMLSRRHDLIKPSLIAGAICITGIACGYVIGLDFLAPHVLNSWWLLKGTPLGVTILGNVPVTELCWFWAISTYLPVLYLYSTGRIYVDGHRVTQQAEDGHTTEPSDQSPHATARKRSASQ
jgi:hypothetical protein